MSELPHSWAIATIGDIAVDCGQKVPGANEAFRYIDIASVDRQTKNIVNPQRLLGKDAPSRARKLVRAGDVLVSMTRPNLNAVALVPDSLNGEIASTGFDVLRSNGPEPRWLFYLVRTASFVDRMSELVQGALYPAVRSKDVRGHVVPIAPFNEQERIADKLDAILARVDACRERLDRVPAILKRFRQAVLAAATSGKLTEEWRSDRRLPQWRSAQLRDLTVLITKGASPKWQGISYVAPESHGTLFVTSENVREMRMDLSNPKYVEAAFDQKQKRSILRRGDLLTNIVGASIGRTAIFESEEHANINQAVCVIRLKNSLNNYFVLYALSGPATLEFMHGEKVDVARANLSLDDIGSIPLVLPGRDEQDEIVRRIEALFAYADRLEARYAAARAQVERSTPALLAKAFRGELVPQDPDDEPASVLLERIRAARAAAPAKPRRGRGAALRESSEDNVEPVVAAHRR